MKTPQQIIDEANELAWLFYESFGYTAPKGYRFDQATHPQEAGMWNLAVIAYERLESTDLDEVLGELGEEDATPSVNTTDVGQGGGS